jgi:hypothetical protein
MEIGVNFLFFKRSVKTISSLDFFIGHKKAQIVDNQRLGLVPESRLELPTFGL